MVAQDFNEIWVVDLGGDVRANPKLSGTKHNVFGIQTGVAIAFMVRRKGADGCTIRYVRRPEEETAEDKLSWLGNARLRDLAPALSIPQPNGAWINFGEDSFQTLLPTANSKTKSASVGSQERAIFKLYSLGVSTNRDEWVYDRNRNDLSKKMQFFTSIFEGLGSKDDYPDEIKWSRNLKRRLAQGKREPYDPGLERASLYRPFSSRWLYQSPLFVDELGSADAISPPKSDNQLICFTTGGRLNFTPFASAASPSLTVLSLDANQCLPRYRYTKSGERIDNITDWAVAQFKAHYEREVAEARFSERVGNGGIAQEITLPDGTKHSINIEPSVVAWPNDNGVPAIIKDAIFAYCYAVLHDPLYREKYALNLKREFPRIPFYDDFAQWVAWGDKLLKLHIDYEKAKPFKLTRIDSPNAKRGKDTHPKPKLKSDSAAGLVVVDEDTQLTGIPAEVWTYRLGNRSAIDWVLDQHKEKTPRDPTIRAKFNTYRFADHKEEMIKLLAKVVTVSLETVKITEAMRSLDRSEAP